eukprot:m.266373 g.266373  ORF g.266373 m.266373 type:complete len:404 (-) comp16036_c0_seq25:4871-6082(-)
MKPPLPLIMCAVVGLVTALLIFFRISSPEERRAVPISIPAPRTKIFIGILSCQADKAAQQRSHVRRTWLGQLQTDYNTTQLASRFFIGRHSASTLMSVAVREEMAVHNDIVVLDVNDAFVALPAKVEAMFNWVATHHPSDYVAKVDDDTYVNLEQLLSEIDPLPRQLLYYGSMRAGPVVRTKGHRNAEPWLPAAMTSFAPYAGGTGYVLSWDLVQVVAFPRLPHLRMLNEDAYIGQLLLPYDIYRYHSNQIMSDRFFDCIPAADLTLLHLSQIIGDGQFMEKVHTNITAQLPVCKARFSGVLNCSFDFPRPSGVTLSNRTGLAWNLTSGTHSCEENEEDIRVMFSAGEMRLLSCCQQLCLETEGCVGIDYYETTTWCNLYDQPCRTPKLTKDGSKSYLLDLPS